MLEEIRILLYPLTHVRSLHPLLYCTYRLILNACGCEDYDDLLRTDSENEDKEDTDNEEDEDEGARMSGDKIKSTGESSYENPVLKMDVMLKKLHADPSTFSALTDSVKSFLLSLPNLSERTILGCYVAER